MILKQNRGVLEYRTNNSPVVGGVPGYGFHPLPECLTLPISESAVPNNGKVGNQVFCPHSRCFASYFDVICFMYLVSSFKPTSSSSIILINPV